MITETNVLEIRTMAKAMGEKLIVGVRRRQDWPLLARTFFSIVRMCDAKPPPLRSIEQKMAEALRQHKQTTYINNAFAAARERLRRSGLF